MIRWSVKPNVAHGNSASQRHTERLDGAIEILIMDGVLIMPDTSGGVRHFVGDERTAIDSRHGLDCISGRSRPDTGRRGHSRRGSNSRKGETRRAGDIVTTIRRIVIHAALPRVSLAPRVLMRTIVLNLGVIRRARVQRCVQVAGIDQNPVRCADVSVAGVALWPGTHWKGPGKGIHPRA